MSQSILHSPPLARWPLWCQHPVFTLGNIEEGKIQNVKVKVSHLTGRDNPQRGYNSQDDAMHDDPKEREGDEENVQESSRQSVRADALQEVLHQSNQAVGMQLQAEEGLPED